MMTFLDGSSSRINHLYISKSFTTQRQGGTRSTVSGRVARIVYLLLLFSGGRTDARLDAPTGERSDGLTVAGSDGLTAARSDGLTVAGSDGLTVARSDGLTVARSDGLTVPRSGV